MAVVEGEECTRSKAVYREENLYIVVSDKRVDLSMANSDEFKTLAGLALVERLVNELLNRGMGLEEISGLCFESSYRAGDLPEILSKYLVIR